MAELKVIQGGRPEVQAQAPSGLMSNHDVWPITIEMAHGRLEAMTEEAERIQSRINTGLVPQEQIMNFETTNEEGVI